MELVQLYSQTASALHHQKFNLYGTKPPDDRYNHYGRFLLNQKSGTSAASATTDNPPEQFLYQSAQQLIL
tara:strand:- start:252 stop:461 length:210 start_codon:yes stop_codon:yes gene_type:complete